MKHRLQANLVGLALILATSNVVANTDEVSKLLSQHRNEEAFQLAKSLEGSHAGDSKFDLQYGLAAIEAGHAQEAIFPLERVIMQDKGNLRARLELARAYIVLGDIDSARRNLTFVKSKNPPMNVQRHITELMASLDRKERNLKYDARPYVAFTLGTDSNLNSATSALTVFVPGIGGQITLGDAAKKKQDNFAEWEAGFNGKYNLSKSLIIFMGANVRDHLHANESAFDQRSWTATAGPALTLGRHLFRMPLQANIVELNRHDFRDTQSAALEYNFTKDKFHKYDIFTQVAKSKYPKVINRVQNTNLFLLGLGYGHIVQTLPLRFNANTYYAKESAKNTLGRHNGKRTYGATLGVQWNYQPRKMLYTNLGLMSVKHAFPHPLFGLAREDALNSAALGWQWNYSSKLSFKTEASYRKNRSNTVIYKFSRTVYTAGLNYSL